MMRVVPTVERYMNNFAKTVDAEDSIAKAGAIMAEFGVRHLAVVSGDKFVGVVSDRELKIKVVGSQPDFDPESVKVKEVCTMNPLMTEPESLLPEVCTRMAQNNISCALVCDNKKLVGIFSWVDAFGAFSDLLMARYNRY